MDDLLTALQEAIELKASLLRGESELWQKIAQAVNAYAKCRRGTQQAPQAPPPSPHNRSAPNPTYLSSKEAAKYMNISRSMIEHWRISGNGPPFIKMGRAVRYRPSDLDAFIAGRIFKHTSAYKR